VSRCIHIEACAFYNNKLKGIPNEGTFFKQLYCQQKSEKCARNKNSATADVSDPNNLINPLGIEY